MAKLSKEIKLMAYRATRLELSCLHEDGTSARVGFASGNSIVEDSDILRQILDYPTRNKKIHAGFIISNASDEECERLIMEAEKMASPPGQKTRPYAELTLPDAVMTVLQTNPNAAYSPTQITAMVKSGGYKSKSKDLKKAVAMTLADLVRKGVAIKNPDREFQVAVTN